MGRGFASPLSLAEPRGRGLSPPCQEVEDRLVQSSALVMAVQEGIELHCGELLRRKHRTLETRGQGGGGACGLAGQYSTSREEEKAAEEGGGCGGGGRGVKGGEGETSAAFRVVARRAVPQPGDGPLDRRPDPAENVGALVAAGVLPVEEDAAHRQRPAHQRSRRLDSKLAPSRSRLGHASRASAP